MERTVRGYRHWWLAVGLLLSLGAGLSQAQGQTTVTMTNNLEFVPDTVTVRAGESVTWRNTSSLVHTVTAVPRLASDPSHVQLPESAQPFNSGSIQPGGSFTHTFTVPGRYRYFCIPHEAAGMVAEVVVEE